MAFLFSDYLFSKLPQYFKENDSYKDQNDEGLLERYLRCFGLELDEQIYPKIKDYLNQVDPATCDEKFLSTIAYTLGSPPDFTGNVADYRKMLQYVLAIYKIKGTAKSYDLLFSLFGLTVRIEEHDNPEPELYDEGDLYDTDPLTYDIECKDCSEYSLYFGTINDDCVPPFFDQDIPQDTLDKLIEIIYFIEPINAKLRGLSREYKICETYERFKTENNTVINDIKEEVIICSYTANLYDNTLLYDNSEEYDRDQGYNCIFIPEEDSSRQFDDSFSFSFA